MSQTTTSILIATLVTILLANPISDDQNQRNSLFSILGNDHNNVNSLRMNPIRLRDNRGLSCPEEGFFTDPRNCSRFYRCVDVANTGYFSIFNFECPTAQVFHEHTNSCVPGVCSSLGIQPSIQPPQPPSVDPPQPMDPPQPDGWQPEPINPPQPMDPPQPDGWHPEPIDPLEPMDPPQPDDGQPEPINPLQPMDIPQPPKWHPDSIIPDGIMDAPQVPEVQPPSTLPPSPPLPSEALSPSPPPNPSITEEPSNSQKPQWLSELPPWFKDTPWWFKTPPAWFHQPPAWFNAPPQSQMVIEEDITLGDSEPIVQTGDIIKGDQPRNVSLDGIIDNASLLNDNKKIRIHIPIHIVQQ